MVTGPFIHPQPPRLLPAAFSASIPTAVSGGGVPPWAGEAAMVPSASATSPTSSARIGDLLILVLLPRTAERLGPRVTRMRGAAPRSLLTRSPLIEPPLRLWD